MESNSLPIGSVSLTQIEQSRKQMHQKIDAQYDELVRKIFMDGKQLTMEDGDQLLPLAAEPARFKGRKPSLLLFPDGRTVAAQNWRRVILEILLDCNQDAVRHERMMQLRDVVTGRLRPLLSGSPREMDIPLMIDENLYLEGKLDTEYLIRTVRDQILDTVGYEYDRLGIVVHDPKLEMAGQVQEQQM